MLEGQVEIICVKSDCTFQSENVFPWTPISRNYMESCGDVWYTTTAVPLALLCVDCKCLSSCLRGHACAARQPGVYHNTEVTCLTCPVLTAPTVDSVHLQGAASPLPGFLFPGFHKAKAALLAAFRKAISAGVLQGTIAEAVYCSSGVCCSCDTRACCTLSSTFIPAASRVVEHVVLDRSVAMSIVPPQESHHIQPGCAAKRLFIPIRNHSPFLATMASAMFPVPRRC